MDRFKAMQTLVAAVDGGSLSAASRLLGVPLPTVSRRISDLEKQLGTQLVVRTSRQLLLTESGINYVAAARRVLDELSEAERAASGEYRTPRGELLVTAPIMFGKIYIAPIIYEFLDAHPEVTVRLILSDGVIDLVDANVDLALRIGSLRDSNLVVRKVGEVRWVVCASPLYLESRDLPSHPSDLAGHDCIAFEGLQRHRQWSFEGSEGPIQVSIHPRFSVNTADALIDAALAGLGLAQLMSYQAAPSIRDGSLIAVLKAWSPTPRPVQLIYPHHRLQPLKLRAFLDFIAPRLQRSLSRISTELD